MAGLAFNDVSVLAAAIPDTLQHLWELVLTADPIVISASNPTACSSSVLAAVSLIHPIIYAGDYRPYFTIQDADVKKLTQKKERPPPVLLGVTNPFFAQSLQHFPTSVRVGENIRHPQSAPSSPAPASSPIFQKTGFSSTTKPDLDRDPSLPLAIAAAATTQEIVC